MRVSVGADVAILTLQSPYHEAPGFTMANVQLCDKVTSVGTPFFEPPPHLSERERGKMRVTRLSQEDTSMTGEVQALHIKAFPYAFRLSVPILVGMSGGPGVLNHGGVVGVNCIGTKQISGLTPSSAVRRLMRSSGEVITTTTSSGIPLDGRNAQYLAGVGAILISAGRDDLAQKYMRQLSYQGSRGARFLKYLRLLMCLR